MAVDERVFEARIGVVVGTGTVPAIPPIDGLSGTPYWTNREAVEAKVPPESLVVLGGGAVGPTGGEVLSGLVVAVHGQVPVERLRHMI